jgi:polyhydroxyalkanoate synthase
MRGKTVAELLKGPRPLALHFSNSQVIWAGAGQNPVSALEKSNWHPDLLERAQDLLSELKASGDTSAFEDAVRAKAQARKETFLAGINSYLSNDYVRAESNATICFELGSARLLDFGGDGEPILMVPSLINPHYILDLMPGRSLAEFLKSQGYRPYLLNWGAPGDSEKHFGLEDYICDRLLPVLEHVVKSAGGAVPLVGYCMGGTLSAAVTAITGGLVSKLVLLAAPWDFETEKPHAGRKYVPEMISHINSLPETGTVAVDVLQTFFTSVDPTLNDRKFRSYAAGKYKAEAAEFFSAMEVWANNSEPLARRAAEECMLYWYKNNDTMHGRWSIRSKTVALCQIDCPVWVAAPKADRLVPQESAFAMVSQLRSATKHAPPSGHIGMVVGDRAKEGLWKPMVKWLEETKGAA